MQSGSWYLGTPGMTVTSLAPPVTGRPRPRARPRARRRRRGSRLGRSTPSVSSAGVGRRCRVVGGGVVGFGGDIGRIRVGRIRFGDDACGHGGARPASTRRRQPTSAGGAGFGGLVGNGGIDGVGDVGGLGRLIRVVVLEPRVASRPVVVSVVDVGGVRDAGVGGDGGRRRSRPTPARSAAVSGFLPWPRARRLRRAVPVPVPVRATGSARGWFEPVEPTRGHGSRSGPGGRRRRRVGVPHPRGERASDGGAVGGDATGVCAWVGAQVGRTSSPDDHGGCGERACQSAAAAPSGADAWPVPVRRCASGGLPNGAVVPGRDHRRRGDRRCCHRRGRRRSAAATAAACAAAAASNAAVAGPGTFFWIGF